MVKALYQTAGEVMGIKLSDYELAFHDKVVGVTVMRSNGGGHGSDDDDGEGRTAWADQIEAEDRAAEAAKHKKRKKCMIS